MLKSKEHTVFCTRWEDIDKLIIPDDRRKHEIEGRKDLLKYSLDHFKQLRGIHINMHPDRLYYIIDGVETYLVLKAMGEKRIVVQEHYYDEPEERKASVLLNNQVSHYSETQIEKFLNRSFEEFMEIQAEQAGHIFTDSHSTQRASKAKAVAENICHVNVRITLSMKEAINKIIRDNGYKNYPGLMKKVIEFHEKGGVL
ncbi:MAG TPA: hypothetical protein VHA56_14455 [Mucilaginibacter sp.]|nr:hypothetical protein [Mucilaginibacter sp.]